MAKNKGGRFPFTSPLGRKPKNYADAATNTKERPVGASPPVAMPQTATSTGAVWREAIAAIMNTDSKPIRRA